MAKVPALSPLNYNTFLGFRDDEMFVLKQLSLGHDIPKIETQIQVKMSRDEPKKSARELFDGICNKLDLRLGSEKTKQKTAARWHGEFVKIRRESVRSLARQAPEKSQQNAKPPPVKNSPPGVPEDIIGYYGLDLDVLAERVDLLPESLKKTLRCLRTGSETGAQIAERMNIQPAAVSANFSDIYKRMGIQHIKAKKHKRIIARLAYLRWAEQME